MVVFDHFEFVWKLYLIK